MDISQDNRIVHGLWIGKTLSNLELLTLRSFVNHGHEFHLWLYDEMATPLPYGVIIEDAARIIPRSRVFKYNVPHQWGKAGSYSGFSDIFRYKLLYELGGWWSDMDVTCLKPIAFPEPYVFRRNFGLAVVGNFMKCPPGSELMLRCYEKSLGAIDENNGDWVLPIRILNEFIEELRLSRYVQGAVSIVDDWRLVERMLFRQVEIDKKNVIIHWMHEIWRSYGIDKNDYKINSTYGKLLIENSLIRGDFTTWDLKVNSLSHALCYRPESFNFKYYARYLSRFIIFRLLPLRLSLHIDNYLSFFYHRILKPGVHFFIRRPAQFFKRNLKRLFSSPRELLDLILLRMGIKR